MPYITQENRALYADALRELVGRVTEETPAGDLTYMVTYVLVDWLGKRGLGYATIADVVKVLETAKLEFYRRVAAPYEDEKSAVNGDVYGDLGGAPTANG